MVEIETLEMKKGERRKGRDGADGGEKGRISKSGGSEGKGLKEAGKKAEDRRVEEYNGRKIIGKEGI